MTDQQNTKAQTLSPEALKEALDKSSSINRTLGLGFSVFIFIMALMVAATTDMDLFIPDSTFTFPLINLPLNIKYFYIAAPFVVLIMHYNLLYNLHQHSEKLLRLYTNKTDNHSEANEATSVTKPDSLLMYPFLFNYALTVQNPLHGRALNLVIRTTIFILPLALLFFILIRFADYQSMTISAWHFAAVLLDMALIATHSRSIIQVIKTRNDEVSDDYGWPVFFAFRKGKPRIKNFTLNAAKFLFRIVPRAISTTFKYLRLELAIALFAVAYFVFFVYIMSARFDRYTSHYSLISYIIPRLSLPEEILVKTQPDQQIKTLYLNTSLTPEERSKREQEIILKFTDPYILKGRSFRYADLRETILTRSDLRKADLTGALLEKSNMQEARLYEAKMQWGSFKEANLKGAILVSANLKEANFISANLQEADFTKANAKGALFSYANLQGASFEQANVQLSRINFAQLQGASFSQFTTFRSASLSYSILPGTNLFKVNFQGADLGYSILPGSDLSETILQGANLVKANLQGANLYNAVIHGIILDSTRIKGTLLNSLSVDTLLMIMEINEANDLFINYYEIESIPLLFHNEERLSSLRTRTHEAKASFKNDTLTLAEKIPNAKIYRPEDLTTDSSFFFIRRRIAAQDKNVAQGMLTSVSFFSWNPEAHPIYKSLYTDLYQFLKSNHPDYIENFPFNEDGY